MGLWSDPSRRHTHTVHFRAKPQTGPNQCLLGPKIICGWHEFRKDLRSPSTQQMVNSLREKGVQLTHVGYFTYQIGHIFALLPHPPIAVLLQFF